MQIVTQGSQGSCITIQVDSEKKRNNTGSSGRGVTVKRGGEYRFKVSEDIFNRSKHGLVNFNLKMCSLEIICNYIPGEEADKS